MKPGAAVRAAAAVSVHEVTRGKSLDAALLAGSSAYQASLKGGDFSLHRELSYGSLRDYPRLCKLVDAMLGKPLRNKDLIAKSLLVVGLYQLQNTRIPAHAAIDSTVSAMSLLRKRPLVGLVNALLRRFQRESEKLIGSLNEPSAAAHPDWLYDRIRSLPQAQADRVLIANNQRPPMSLRINQSQTTRSEYENQLSSACIESVPGTLSELCLTLTEPQDVTALPGFTDGWCSVQDETAQVAATLLAPLPGERILDACGAPGGKACHILELQPDCKLLVTDVDQRRLALVEENFSRLGLNGETIVADASESAGPLSNRGPFDAILTDVPCSASGVVRRHPDIKLLRRPEDIPQFAEQQIRILRGVWPLLRSGGRLLYVTCSIFPEENEELVNRFLLETPDAFVRALSIDGGTSKKPGVQFLPDPNGGDGLYFCLLKKR
ncbi:MAG: 16S rRNA (cytosine(967)-C(5))-methyltransferase RsmB [Pseudomonadota bacterium]